MHEIHCHSCGGFIIDPAAISYLPPGDRAVMAPRTGLCACNPAVVYGQPPGKVSGAWYAKRN
jgi:hypothetical protein